MNFVGLYQSLDASQSTLAKRDALIQFIKTADALESAFGIALLLGYRLPQRLSHRMLRQTASHIFTDTPWLFEDCYAAVGDLSETLAILLADTERPAADKVPVLTDWVAQQQRLTQMAPEQVPNAVITTLQDLSRDEAFLFLKLSTGGFRVGVSRGLVHDAIARVIGIDRAVIDERLMGGLTPERNWLELLSQPVSDAEAQARPLPFLLANPWQPEDQEHMSPDSLVAEYKWDGIRCQLIKTDDLIRLWSRGDHDITTQFPDLVAAAQSLPSGLILDGEILILKEGHPESFASLQVRLNRKRVTNALLASHPAVFRAYDCLRYGGDDLRDRPLHERRERLASLPVEQSPQIEAETWEQLTQAREAARQVGAEGLMLKRSDGPYLSGRKAGLWWKWKLDPMTADCVLIYAQAGHGRRATLHTDFTLAAWQEDQLVPVAKAYSGLSDAELKQIDRWVRDHTEAKFGPVRQVLPQLVFEIGFEGIARSTRHKSGIALRFPRILRWRQDIGIADADHLSHFHQLLAIQ